MYKLFGVILITFISGMLGTALGGSLTLFIKRDSKRLIGLLEGLASGIILGTVCFHFVSEAMHTENGHDHSPTLTVILFMFAGFAAVLLLDLLLTKKFHHSHEGHHGDQCQCCDDDPRKLIVAGFVMVCSVALHNLPIGIVIGASSLGGSELITSAALSTALAVTIHNLPEGMATAVPFISGGMKKTIAISLTSLSGITTVIGGIIGYEIGNVFPMALTVMLSLAAGAMIFVVFCELIPESLTNCSSREMTAAIILGLAVSMLLVFGGVHAHA